jgi:hypothetical protein
MREQLVSVALHWEERFGNAPAITSALSKYDAALLVGLTEAEYSSEMSGATTVRKGYDFMHNGKRYQVKGNRPSGKPGSFVTWVPKAANYDWDYLVWVLYDRRYVVQEAWLWDVEAYRSSFHEVSRLSPAHHRGGLKIA